jgi:hypothetical protein
MFAAAGRIEEPTPTTEPTSLAEWFAKSGYLPANLMLETLAEFAPELATHHRTQGSDKTAILRSVKAHISEGSK